MAVVPFLALAPGALSVTAGWLAVGGILVALRECWLHLRGHTA